MPNNVLLNLSAFANKKWLIFFSLLFSCCLANGQVFQIGKRIISFADSSRNNRPISTAIFYPANISGDNVPLASGSQLFPVVVFGHGFVIPYTAYQWLADSLVKNGYIVAMPTTESGLSPAHEQFGKDLAFLCRHLLSLSDSANSFLFARVKQRSAVGGHSMGGGCSLLASNYNTGINALFNFAAAETNPSAKQAATAAQLPSLIFSGSADCIVRDSNQLAMYQNVPYPCKTYINITNALHCQFANNDGTCATGQFFSGCNTSPISAATVFEKVTRLLLPFLDYYLKDSCGSKLIFEDRFASITGVTKLRTCLSDPFLCNAVNTYTFTGSGNWSIAANWLNNNVPPNILTTGNRIIINPPGSSSCILNVSQSISTGASIEVMPGKNLVIAGDLLVQ